MEISFIVEVVIMYVLLILHLESAASKSAEGQDRAKMANSVDYQVLNALGDMPHQRRKARRSPAPSLKPSCSAI